MVGPAQADKLIRFVKLTSRRFAAFAAIAVLFCAWNNLRAEEKPVPLAQTKMFVMGGFGYGSTTSIQEIQFHDLLKQKDAEAACLNLIKKGSPAAKLYGLLGLRLLKSPYYERYYQDLKKSKKQIDTGSGCVLSLLPSSSVVYRINKGYYDKS